MLKCKDCGNTERFERTNTVIEIALYDGDEEFLDVLTADTVDSYSLRCHECDSENVGPDRRIAIHVDHWRDEDEMARVLCGNCADSDQFGEYLEYIETGGPADTCEHCGVINQEDSNEAI